MCVCVCVRERERKRETSSWVIVGRDKRSNGQLEVLSSISSSLCQSLSNIWCVCVFSCLIVLCGKHFRLSFSFLSLQILWAASIFLEAVAILPQLVLLQRTKNVDNLTGNYVFLLGMYRATYILNWIYRYFTEENYVHWLGGYLNTKPMEPIPQQPVDFLRLFLSSMD